MEAQVSNATGMAQEPSNCYVAKVANTVRENTRSYLKMLLGMVTSSTSPYIDARGISLTPILLDQVVPKGLPERLLNSGGDSLLPVFEK